MLVRPRGLLGGRHQQGLGRRGFFWWGKHNTLKLRDLMYKYQHSKKTQNFARFASRTGSQH